MPVAEVVGAAIEVQVQESPPVEVPEAIALAPADDQRDTELGERLDTARHDVLVGHRERTTLRF